MTDKNVLLTIGFYFLSAVLVVPIIICTWPPTPLTIIIWILFGGFASSTFIYEDVKSRRYAPIMIEDYINWVVWFVSGPLSIMTMLFVGWYFYRKDRNIFKGKTLR